VVSATAALAHASVAEAAELGALADVDAGLVGLHPQRVHTAGDCVALAVELRDPVAVDDVAAGDAQQHVGVGGDHQLTAGDDGIGDLDATADTALDVVVLPPPLLAGDVDDAIVLLVGQLKDLHDGRDGDHGEDDGRQDGEQDLELGVAVRLLRNVLPAILELPDGVTDGGEDQHADDPGDVEQLTLQAVDAAGVRALRLERVLRGVLRAARQQHCHAHSRCGHAPTATAESTFVGTHHFLTLLHGHGTKILMTWSSRPGTCSTTGVLLAALDLFTLMSRYDCLPEFTAVVHLMTSSASP
jgi:hypothetical protein